MDRLRGVLKQLRALVHRRAANRELEDELAFHVEMATAENERLGMSTEEAHRRALISFGGVERAGHARSARQPDGGPAD